MSFNNTVHIAIELSVLSWLVAVRTPGSGTSRLRRLNRILQNCGRTVIRARLGRPPGSRWPPSSEPGLHILIKIAVR